MLKFFNIKKIVIIAFAMMLISASVFALEQDFYPDDDGVYTVESTGISGEEYVVLVVSGTAEGNAFPEITGENILYYGVTKCENGKVYHSFVPSSYTDGTVFLLPAEASQDTPRIAGYIKAGDAKDVARIEVTFDKAFYIVKGDGSPVYANYTVKAYDSFGYETSIPEDISKTVTNDTNNNIRIMQSDSLEIGHVTERGTYTFTISYGDVSGSCDFNVYRAASVPEEMLLTVNGETRTNYVVSFYNDVDGGEFSPEKLDFEITLIDQFGDNADISYIYNYAPLDEDGKPLDSISLGTYGSSYSFIPPDMPGVDEYFDYNVSVVPDLTLTESQKNEFTKTVKVMLVGRTRYTGAQLDLYTALASARDYADMIESGNIVIDTSSTNVEATKQWTTEEYKDALESAIASAEAVLLDIKAGESISEDAVNREAASLNAVLDSFEDSLKKGVVALIERIWFDSNVFDLPVGKSKTVAAYVSPQRPSEKLLYSSSDENVATVNERTGAVRAVSEGSAIITAESESGNVSSYYTVNVYTEITALSFAQNTLSYASGTVFTPTYTALPANHSDTVTLTSSNTRVARISSGSVVAVASGESVITATTKSGKQAKFTLYVNTPAFSTPQSIRAKAGGSVKIPVYIQNGYGLTDISLSIEYDENVFEFLSSQAVLVRGAFESTDNGNGTVNSFIVPDGVSADCNGVLAEYTFGVSEQAQYGEYTFDITLSPMYQSNIITATGRILSLKAAVSDTDTYRVSFKNSDGSEITDESVVGGTVSGDGDYKYGETVTLSASRSTGYVFKGWYDASGNELSNKITYTFEVTKDTVIIPKFSKEQNYLGGGGGGGGSTSQLKYPVSKVTSDIESGEIIAGTKITLSCETEGAKIYYTTDGSDPSENSIFYNLPIIVSNSNIYIRAIAVKDGMNNSEISEFSYTLKQLEVSKDVTISLKDDVKNIKYVPAATKYIRPNDAATRYEVIEMLNNLFDIKGVTDTVITFPDLSATYKDMVELYAAAGIINGYPDGTFGGHKGITRAELVKILCVMLGVDVSGQQTSDTDVHLSDISGHWAENSIKAFVSMGYILGYPEGDFRPDKQITRTEVITIFNRITGVEKVSGIDPYFNDLSEDFWGYDDIMNSVIIP